MQRDEERGGTASGAASSERRALFAIAAASQRRYAALSTSHWRFSDQRSVWSSSKSVSIDYTAVRSVLSLGRSVGVV